MKRKTKTGIILAVSLAALGLAASGLVLAGGGYCKGGWHGPKPAGMGPGHSGRSLFEQLDSNGDGKLTAEEAKQSRGERLDRFDSNGDGRLALSEFEGAWLEAMRTRMVRAFQSLDRDGDGQVTEAEYRRPVTRKLQRMDREGDGAVTRAEMRGRRHGFEEHHRDND